jgi:hypothetical protein
MATAFITNGSKAVKAAGDGLDGHALEAIWKLRLE